MIEIENKSVWRFEHAIRGMRNPMNSWDKSDSEYKDFYNSGNFEGQDFECFAYREYKVGKNDLELMQKLFKAGTEHRKYLRQIFVSMDITAPLYWWKEFDTYKIGTVANSCSTMHTIHKKEFELDDFSHEHLSNDALGYLNEVIERLNYDRSQYNLTKDKDSWWNIIQLLPSSYNQKRTITMNYENVVNIINQRTGHKLDEWSGFVVFLKHLPYVNEIMVAK